MKTTALKSASAAFLAGLLVLGVVVATTYVNTNVLIETANRATLSHEVLESVTLLRLQAMAIESSIRGYAITGDPRSLALYRESLEEIPPHLVRLKGLTADNRDQQRALIDLDPLLNQLILASKGVIEARDQFGAGAALDLVRSPHSEELMESIRQVLGKMENRETILLQARSLGSRESARKTTFIVVLAGILTLAIAAGAGYALYREFVQRDRVSEEMQRNEEKFRALSASSPSGVFLADVEGRFQYTNAEFQKISGSPLEATLGTGWMGPVHDEDRASLLSHWQAAVAEGRAFQRDFRCLRPNGELRWVRARAAAIDGRDGRPIGFVGTHDDITDRKQAEASLQAANDMLSSTVEQLQKRTIEINTLSEMSELLQSCQDLAEAFPILSKTLARLFPETRGFAGVTNSSRNIVHEAAPWGGDGVPAGTAARGDGGGAFAPEDCWALRRGRIHHVENAALEPVCQHLTHVPAGWCLCVPMMAQGEAIGVLHIEALARDRVDGSAGREAGHASRESPVRLATTVAEQAAIALANVSLRETLRSQSIRDPLSGVFNRRFMEESLEREFHRSQRNSRPIGLIMMDIDHFKRYNDTFGHGAGDTVIRELGAFLSKRVRPSDIVCRFGGEEFVVILPEASVEDTVRRANRFREEIKQLVPEHEGRLLGQVTLSLGVAVLPEHGGSTADILRVADAALYSAKAAGRDRVMVGPPLPSA